MAAPQSPFLQPERRRFTFGMDWLLLITLVAAATATLAGYALSLPSVRNELNAWLGRTGGLESVEGSRRQQLIFLLMCYWSPMLLGLAARLIYLVTMQIVRLVKVEDSDEEFRMEA